MRKLEEFYKLKADSDNPDQLVKKAVTVVGLQNISDVRKVWVFNGKVHIGDGWTANSTSGKSLHLVG